MKQCEFCGANMIDAASFCGKCGCTPSHIAQRSTRISDASTTPMSDLPGQDDDNETLLSVSGKHPSTHTPSAALHPITLVPIYDEHEDTAEEKHRRAALFGMELPLLEELANHPTLGHVPVIQAAPQIAQLPTLPNTPQIQAGPPLNSSVSTAQPPLPHIQSVQTLPPPPARPIRPPGRTGSHTLGKSPGCLPLGVLFLAAILIILLTSIGLSLTAFAPGLSLSGSTTVIPGSDLILHGHNFLPNSSVTLTLDNGSTLPLVYSQTSTQPIGHQASALAHTRLALDATLQPATNTVISTRGDGTFNATILVSLTWATGHHTIHASEAVSHRSASLPFTISQPMSATATPTATLPASTPTPTPGTTPTATATPPPTLSCATPGRLSLGPIGALSSQVASASVTLCTAGSGTLTWKASWDQNQASWLQVKQNHGSVQAPEQIQTTVSASATKLTAGTYTATITFMGLESNTTQEINVTLTVKASCVSATPQSLKFSGVEGVSDPNDAQDISITNCGLTSNWSATIDNGSSWLSLNASKGTLQGGSTRTIAVTASNLNADLKAGTYKDTITFSIGSDTATVNVSLVVQAASPDISVSPTSVNSAASPCTIDDNGNSDCTITLTNKSNSTALTWSASSNGNGVTVQASSTTISAGNTEQVTIIVPASNCGTTLTVTFNAPGNSASVTWHCTPTTPT